MSDEKCKGCITDHYETGTHHCYWDYYNKDGTCPCSNCLVKMMCNEACDEFEKWNGWIKSPMDEEQYAEWEHDQKTMLKESDNDR